MTAKNSDPTKQRTRVTPEEEARVRDLHGKGLLKEQIAAEMGINKNRLSAILRSIAAKGASLVHSREARGNIIRNARVGLPSPEEYSQIIEQVRAALATGMKRKDIAVHIGQPIDRVLSIVQVHCKDLRLSPEAKARNHEVYKTEQRQAVTVLRRRGESISKIAEATGLSLRTANYLALKEGVTLSPEQRADASAERTYSRELRQRVVELRRNGVTRREVASTLGLSEATIKTLQCRARLVLPMALRTRNSQAGRFAVDPNHLEKFRATAYTPEANARRAISVKAAWKAPHLRQNASSMSLARWKAMNPHERTRYTWADVEQASVHIKLSKDFVRTDAITPSVNVTCRCGVEFETSTYNLIYGTTSSCGCIKSQPERDLYAFVKELVPSAVSHDRTIISPQELDVLLPEHGIAFEYCGLFWHGETVKKEKAPTYHLKKLEACESKGVRLVTIFADEWLGRRQQTEAYLKAILNVGSVSYGARKLALGKAPSAEVSAFFEVNHIQGGRGSEMSYVLRHEGTIVAAMSFWRSSPSRKGKPEEGFWELSRYCVAMGVSVQGGFARLFRAFTAENSPKAIVSFSDRRWSQGGLYRRSNFVEDGVVASSYWYTKKNDDKFRYHKAKFRKEKIAKNLGPLLEGETEAEAMRRFGFDRIWDCGLIRWMWTP